MMNAVATYTTLLVDDASLYLLAIVVMNIFRCPWLAIM